MMMLMIMLMIILMNILMIMLMMMTCIGLTVMDVVDVYDAQFPNVEEM